LEPWRPLLIICQPSQAKSGPTVALNFNSGIFAIEANSVPVKFKLLFGGEPHMQIIMRKWINAKLKKIFGYEIKMVEKTDKQFSKFKNSWNYSETAPWIGGRLPVSNLTGGYHGILQQWWEHYQSGNSWLLISENKKIANELKVIYKDISFLTMDLYGLQSDDIDIIADICKKPPKQCIESFDAVICQATLEHVYSPFEAMKCMFEMLKQGGYLFLHTQTPGFPYHGFPRDYQRFYLDWFEDMGSWIPGVELIELYSKSGSVFVVYKKS
jgi:SAM-dependent methyltransferase